MRELIVDSFAGGGGASTGIEMALGRSPDYAINHDPDALALHRANHPDTVHLSRNIYQVDPMDVVGRRTVGLLWASPDCKHFSKAKGGRPVKRNIRDLGWTVVLWAKRARPRLIILENVEEYQDWGPLIEREPGVWVPDPERKGETFRRWVGELRRLGYRVEWRELRACDFGAPTTRKRLFLIARRDGKPIVWPAPTHGKPADPDVIAGAKLPWRTAAEIIDWSLPCPSIFLTREEGRAIGVNRPLAEATMARIAKGVKRYVIDAATPFIVPITHTGSVRVHAIDEPVRTVTTAQRGEMALVAPMIAGIAHGDSGGRRAYAMDEPLTTVQASGNNQALVAPHLTKFRSGAVGSGADEPVPTVTANSFVKRPGGAAPIGVAAVHLQRQFGASVGHGADEPVATVTAGGGGKTALVAAHLQAYYGPGAGGSDRSADPAEPTRTITTENRHAVVAAFLAQHNAGPTPGAPGRAADEPVSTITATGSQQAVVSAGLVNLRGADRRGADVAAPVGTVTAGGTHVAEVRAFLTKYFGTDQDPRLEEPLHTVTTRDRFGLVTVEGEVYEIADIGMRMLSPRELFRAQGFPDRYEIDHGVFEDGDRRPLTKTAQVRMCGNSVSPVMAAALVAANCADMAEIREAAE